MHLEWVTDTGMDHRTKTMLQVISKDKFENRVHHYDYSYPVVQRFIGQQPPLPDEDADDDEQVR